MEVLCSKRYHAVLCVRIVKGFGAALLWPLTEGLLPEYIPPMKRVAQRYCMLTKHFVCMAGRVHMRLPFGSILISKLPALATGF